jgi:hypothetical protein
VPLIFSISSMMSSRNSRSGFRRRWLQLEPSPEDEV